MRIGTILLVIWLIIGAVAAGQRHYFSSSGTSCAKASTIAVTVIAGPLNYVGVNPKVACKTPHPSKWHRPAEPVRQRAAGNYRRPPALTPHQIRATLPPSSTLSRTRSRQAGRLRRPAKLGSTVRVLDQRAALTAASPQGL